jgi:ParB family chromosome partitioning protein
MTKSSDKFTGRALNVLKAGRAAKEHPLTDSDFSSRVYISQIPLDLIEPNPDQSRITFDTAKLHELASSIKAKGVIKPIIVQEITEGQQYRIIAGERRWRASKIAGEKKIPAIIKHGTQDNDIIGIIENVQRENLSAIEECLAYNRLKESGMIQREIAASIGKEESHVSKCIKIAEFLKELRKKRNLSELRMSNGGNIGIDHLLAVASIADFDKAVALLDEIISMNLKRDDVRERSKRSRGKSTPVNAWHTGLKKMKAVMSNLDFQSMQANMPPDVPKEHLVKEIDETLDVINKAQKNLQQIRSQLEE